MTLTLPEQLKERLEPFSRWLPAILELSLLTLKTPAQQEVTALIEFLASNPTPGQVHDYRLSDPAQKRLEGLFAQNAEAVLAEAETRELDEYLKLEHVVRMIKARLSSDELAGV